MNEFALSAPCEACGCWPRTPGSEMCSECQQKYRIRRNGSVKRVVKK